MHRRSQTTTLLLLLLASAILPPALSSGAGTGRSLGGWWSSRSGPSSASSSASIDFSAVRDSYTSLFAPCDLTFYRDGQVDGEGGSDTGEQTDDAATDAGADADVDDSVNAADDAPPSLRRRNRRSVHHYLCESLYSSDIIGRESTNVIFWPDAAVGTGPVCYSASDAPTLEEESLARFGAFVRSVEDAVNDTAVNAEVESIVKNATERIRAQFARIPGEATHLMVNCTADRALAREIDANAEMAIYVGGAAVLAILVCLCACCVASLWCCCCRGEKKIDQEQAPYEPVPAVRVQTGLTPVETGLAPVEAVAAPNNSPKFDTIYGSTT